jgi:hypothetical protein
MFCTNCGTPLKEGAAFCVHCGTKVEPGAAVNGQSVSQPVVQPAETAPPQPPHQRAPGTISGSMNGGMTALRILSIIAFAANAVILICIGGSSLAGIFPLFLLFCLFLIFYGIFALVQGRRHTSRLLTVMSVFLFCTVLLYIPVLLQTLGNMWGTDYNWIVVIFPVCMVYSFVFSTTALVVSFRQKTPTPTSDPAVKKKAPAAGLIIAAALVIAAGCGIISVKASQGSVPKTGRGYDMVKWNSSPEKVRSVYGIGDDIQLRHLDGDGENIFSLVQENVSDTIIKRTFKFASGKLFTVQVFYAAPVKPDSIKTSLTEKYGPATDTRVSEKRTSEPVYEMSMSRGLRRNLDGSMVQGWNPAQFRQTGTKTTVEKNYTVTFDQYLPTMHIDFYYGDTWDTWVRYRSGNRPEGQKAQL